MTSARPDFCTVPHPIELAGGANPIDWPWNEMQFKLRIEEDVSAAAALKLALALDEVGLYYSIWTET